MNETNENESPQDYIEEFTKLNNQLINLQRELTLKNKRMEQLSAELEVLNADLENRVEERTRELQETQDRLRRSENLAMVGKLAGFVGHELRNTLSGIGLAAQLLKKTVNQGDEKSQKVIALLDESYEKTRRIITELLDFSKILDIKKENSCIHQLIDYALRSPRKMENIAVQKNYTDEDDCIQADTIQLDRVFKNLINNAIEAMPEGGTISITTKRLEKKFKITIEDTGTGIAEKNMGSVFTPLFTTKKAGVGLGLVFVKEIIEAHGGTIDFSSEVDAGTCFIIHLPVS